MGKAWCVVEFDDGVQVVPQIWIKGDQCYWPAFKSANSQKLYEKAVREYEDPKEAWALYRVRILGVYESYELAIPKLELAEIQSDLNGDDDNEESRRKTRGIRKRIPLSSSDEEGEEHDFNISFPKVPQKKITTHDGVQSKGADDYLTLKSKVGPLLTTSASTSTSTTSSDMIPQKAKDCCTCCCKFDKEYKEKTKEDLKEIKSQLKLILQGLREQGRPQPSLNNYDEEFLSDENFVDNLPVKSIEELDAWERKLNSKDEQKKMVLFLAKIGGRDTNTIVKNILKKVISDFVAAQFNWEGKKGKKMLSALILSDCIRKAAALSPNAKASTEQDIISAIRNWLRHAGMLPPDGITVIELKIRIDSKRWRITKHLNDFN